MASEKHLEKLLRETVERMGGLCLKLLPFLFTGLPDRLILLPGGRIYFAETKTTGEALRPRQKYVKKQLEKLGFKVYVIDTYVALQNCLNEI
jgi:hypothetical protein